jgi:Domain of unknown function (DUF6647)
MCCCVKSKFFSFWFLLLLSFAVIWVAISSGAFAITEEIQSTETDCEIEPIPGAEDATDQAFEPEALAFENSREVVRDLIEWIGQNTNYDIERSLTNPPSVSFCDTGETIEYEAMEIVVDAQLRAAYDAKIRHVFLVRPWDASDTMDQSRLLHELIHDVQYLNRGWNCLQEPEWEAYKLQEMWLAQNGLDANFDWLQIFFASRCPRDIHPG